MEVDLTDGNEVMETKNNLVAKLWELSETYDSDGIEIIQQQHNVDQDISQKQS